MCLEAGLQRRCITNEYMIVRQNFLWTSCREIPNSDMAICSTHFEVYICGFSYSYKGSLYSTVTFSLSLSLSLSPSLSHTHTHIILLKFHIISLIHIDSQKKNIYNKTRRLDLVPNNQLIRGLPLLSPWQFIHESQEVFSTELGDIWVCFSDRCDGVCAKTLRFNFLWELELLDSITPTSAHTSVSRKKIKWMFLSGDGR